MVRTEEAHLDEIEKMLRRPGTVGESDSLIPSMTEERMVAITGIDHIVLRVTDLDRAVRFYTQVLGMSVAKNNEGAQLIHLSAGSGLIDLVAVDGPLGRIGGGPPGVENRNVDHICLQVRDFDLEKIKAHLRAHGVEPGAEGERYGAGGDGLSLYLTDPDGNGLELRAAP
jgi:catechol 2,3-dioxygenase-like lactoylglutathione lyase family enzyme